MTLTYEFVVSERPFYFMHGGIEDIDYEVETEEFEYDPDYDELLQYFNELSEVEFVDGCEHAWEQLSEEQKAFFLDPKNGYAIPENMNGDEYNWNAVYRDLDGKGDFITELLWKDPFYWQDELKYHFEEDAREAWKDSR